jgi:HlyD family secretion protein
MASRSGVGLIRAVWLWLLLAVATIAAAWFVIGPARRAESARMLDEIEWVVVRRGDLDTTLLAGGDLEPIEHTTVACQVEDVADSDGTMILSLISNGAVVKKGDELCRLESSALEEAARQQEIAVNQARALCLQARLVRETAGIALRQYQEGLVVQLRKEFDGRIALGRSDTQRQANRVAWTEGMVAKGYLAQSQLLTERHALEQARHELRKAEGEFRLFQRFQAPKEIQALKSQRLTAEINYRVEADRKKAAEDRLTHLRKQVENCTIRAPHAGVVLHAYEDRPWALPFQPGDRVYQDQVMFRISDLTRMEVMVSIAESMGPRVRVGMKANVCIAAREDRVFTGRVTAIDQLPSVNWKMDDDNVKRFVARVRLDETPPGTMMFMSAAVEFDTGHVADSLVIPVEAVSVADRRETCFVVAAHGLERRAIKTRRATTGLLEVTGGLLEGERVVLRPMEVRGIPVVDRTRDSADESFWVRTAPSYPPESTAQSDARPPRFGGPGGGQGTQGF